MWFKNQGHTRQIFDMIELLTSGSLTATVHVNATVDIYLAQHGCKHLIFDLSHGHFRIAR